MQILYTLILVQFILLFCLSIIVLYRILLKSIVITCISSSRIFNCFNSQSVFLKLSQRLSYKFCLLNLHSPFQRKKTVLWRGSVDCLTPPVAWLLSYLMLQHLVYWHCSSFVYSSSLKSGKPTCLLPWLQWTFSYFFLCLQQVNFCVDVTIIVSLTLIACFYLRI